jgi:hypothetical protein
MFSWSDRKPPPVPANLLSLNKIEIDRYSSEIALIEGAWGGIFYYPQFVKPAARALNLKGGTCFLEFDGNIICGLNLLLQNRRLIRAATVPLLFQYFGPLPIRGSFNLKEMESVDRYISTVCDFVYFSLSPSAGGESVFPRGWRSVPTITLALGERDMAGWGSGFRDDVKNKIRKAKRERIHVETSETLPEKLWMLAYRRRGISLPLSPGDLTQWCSELMGDSLLKLYVARSGDVPVAFRGELLQGRFAYDWIAGSDPDYHSSGANQLLMAEIGDDLKSRNIKTWDLVGGQIKSIAEFKKSFGAREVSHHQAYKSLNFKGGIFGIARKLKNAWSR